MATSKLQALWNHPAGPKTSESSISMNVFFFTFDFSHGEIDHSIFIIEQSVFVEFHLLFLDLLCFKPNSNS